MRVIGYIRVSTEEQSREGISLDMQRDKIWAYCGLNDLALVDVYEDAGISAKDIKHRPGFSNALDFVLRGQADGLVIYKLDRAFRNTSDALAIAEQFRKKGAALHSITEKLDTQSAIGEFFFTLMAALAQMERKLIGERTRDALAKKRSNGEKTGGHVPYGYASIDGVLIMNPEEQALIQRVKRARQMGLSIAMIRRNLVLDGVTNRKGQPFAPTQIRRILAMKGGGKCYTSF